MFWQLVFSIPQFWDAVGGKRSFCMLREVCKAFRAEIPEREALRRIFRGSVMRKAGLFRILPLTVHDVMRLRSPVDFLEAFSIAERKAGGFANCMAIVREKGWQCWCREGQRRATLRAQVDVELDPAVLQRALQRSVCKARVWRYESTLEELMPWWIFNPFREMDRGPRAWGFSGIMFTHYQRRQLFKIFRGACGGKYRGIFKDVRMAERALKEARAERKAQTIHCSISNGILLVGVVAMRQWQPIPRTELAVDTP